MLSACRRASGHVEWAHVQSLCFPRHVHVVMMSGAENVGRSRLRIIAFDERDDALPSAKLF